MHVPVIAYSPTLFPGALVKILLAIVFVGCRDGWIPSLVPTEEPQVGFEQLDFSYSYLLYIGLTRPVTFIIVYFT